MMLEKGVVEVTVAFGQDLRSKRQSRIRTVALFDRARKIFSVPMKSMSLRRRARAFYSGVIN